MIVKLTKRGRPPLLPPPPCGTCEQCLKKACKAGAFAKSEHGYNKCLHCTSSIVCTKTFPGPGQARRWCHRITNTTAPGVWV